MLEKDFLLSLSFDDVLVIPGYSEVLPSECQTKSYVTKNYQINVPILSSAMDTVTEFEMAKKMASLGGLGVIHKNMTPDNQAEIIKQLKAIAVIDEQTSVNKEKKILTAAAVGVSDLEKVRVDTLAAAGIDIVVVDTAHGHSKGVGEMVKYIKKTYPKIDVVAGNVATAEAVEFLAKAGADAVKVGIGPGSICTTRVVAGVGLAQFSAITECAKACVTHKIPMIGDGGIKYSGDIVKALGAGASTVMLGSLFAGTLQAPGEVITIEGKQFKSYRGMGSMGAMVKGSKDRYGQGKVENQKLVPEGVEGVVAYKGDVEIIFFQLAGGIRSGMGYVGAANINELHKKTKFARITSAGLKESHPHDIQITVKAPNY